jgi:hypothetical protein
MITILLIIIVAAAFIVIASGVWVSIALIIAITGQKTMPSPQNTEGKAEVRC